MSLSDDHASFGSEEDEDDLNIEDNEDQQLEYDMWEGQFDLIATEDTLEISSEPDRSYFLPYHEFLVQATSIHFHNYSGCF